MHNFDLNLKKITKIEGNACLEIKVRDRKIKKVKFKMIEFKRFYTHLIRGKSILAIPQILSRICGTCSNAHLICSIEAAEKALDIKVSERVLLLRMLTMYGLIIRDHALHLYFFVLPDIYNKDSFLDFDEKNPKEDQILHNGFDVKNVGNYLSKIIAGRSVHAPYPVIGGHLHFPTREEIKIAIKKLQKIRPAVLRLIKIFRSIPFHFDRKTHFRALIAEKFGFLKGQIVSDKGEIVPENRFSEHLKRVIIPYSHAVGYKFKGEPYMVGALARLNLAKDRLHPKTKDSIKKTLNIFPSTDIFYNNLAQAIEILHSIDASIEILKNYEFKKESVIKKRFKKAEGIGVIEAPRGTLYHKLVVNRQGKIVKGEIIVPTNQNQINIEKDISDFVKDNFQKISKKQMIFEIEKLIRAYDPCISCASHFLKVKIMKS